MHADSSCAECDAPLPAGRTKFCCDLHARRHNKRRKQRRDSLRLRGIRTYDVTGTLFIDGTTITIRLDAVDEVAP